MCKPGTGGGGGLSGNPNGLGGGSGGYSWGSLSSPHSHSPQSTPEYDSDPNQNKAWKDYWAKHQRNNSNSYRHQAQVDGPPVNDDSDDGYEERINGCNVERRKKQYRRLSDPSWYSPPDNPWKWARNSEVCDNGVIRNFNFNERSLEPTSESRARIKRIAQDLQVYMNSHPGQPVYVEGYSGPCKDLTRTNVNSNTHLREYNFYMRYWDNSKTTGQNLRDIRAQIFFELMENEKVDLGGFWGSPTPGNSWDIKVIVLSPTP